MLTFFFIHHLNFLLETSYYSILHRIKNLFRKKVSVGILRSKIKGKISIEQTLYFILGLEIN